MKQVHDNIVQDKKVLKAKDCDDKLGWPLIHAEAIEQLRCTKAAHASSCYPFLDTCSKQSGVLAAYLDPAARATHLQAVRDHILVLAREDIAQEVHFLQMQNREAGGDRIHQKEHILKKLRRISPGESNSLGAIQGEDGSIHSTPKEMAE